VLNNIIKEQASQRPIKGAIGNSAKYQIVLHHCDELVETIEMDISFAYFGVRMR
jgi:hypothetical protein